MKTLRRTTLVAAVAAGLFVPTTALGDSTFCNPSGDCVTADRQGREIFLKLRTGRFDGRYQICIEGGGVRCKTFTLVRRPDGSAYSSVRYRTQFADRGPGRYRARWRRGDQTLGTLTFRLP